MQRPLWERKKGEETREKKGILSPMTAFPLHMLHFLVAQSRESEKIFDVFLPALFMHLVHMTASNHQTRPASAPRKRSCVSLPAAKVALEIRWRRPERKQGWWGKRTGKWETCLMG